MPRFFLDQNGNYYEAIEDVDAWPEGHQPTTQAAPSTAQVVPSEVSRFQARMALRAAGLFDAADGIITAAGGDALIAWNEAVSFYRTSPLIASLAPALWPEATEEQIQSNLDALFIAAGGVAV